MTPRCADVAFALESCPGVRGFFVIAAGSAAAERFDFAVEIEPDGRTLAGVHYALLRVLTHAECARVFLFHTAPPGVIRESMRPAQLTDAERTSARRRAPPLARPSDAGAPLSSSGSPSVLILDGGASIEGVLREALGDPARGWIASSVSAAALLAESGRFDLVLCDSRHAFGRGGLLAKLPLEVAMRVLILTSPSDFADARGHLQGAERIVMRPLEGWVLREKLVRSGLLPLLPPPLPSRAGDGAVAPRKLPAPAASAPFTALLVDVDETLHHALRAVFPEEARHLLRRSPEDATQVAFATPLHLVLCSANAALHPRSFLGAVAREDAAFAARAVVVAPARDVPYVRHSLQARGLPNTVLPLPIDEALLRHEIFRRHPELVARLALAEVATSTSSPVTHARYRRLAVLVVDDELTTQILFEASPVRRGDADVTLAATPMDAFAHVTSRPVDLLVVSATMRGDGGEPFYRVLWRLSPALKARSVLLASGDVPGALPAFAAGDPVPRLPPRLVARPLTGDLLEAVVEAHAEQTPLP